VRALAILGEKRVDSLPQVPTMAEAGFPGPEYITVGGLMLMTASGVPLPVRDRLEAEARAAIQPLPLKARFPACSRRGARDGAPGSSSDHALFAQPCLVRVAELQPVAVR
jgi:hypothetical protein